jgi:hypothetical protein
VGGDGIDRGFREPAMPVVPEALTQPLGQDPLELGPGPRAPHALRLPHVTRRIPAVQGGEQL